MNIHKAFRPTGIVLMMLIVSASLSAQDQETFTLEAMRDPSFFNAFAVPQKHSAGDPAGRRQLQHTELDFWKRNL